MNKYQRNIKGVIIDVYDILKAYGVTCPGTQHAIKKLLMPGDRGHKDQITDLKEARSSIDRSIQLATPLFPNEPEPQIKAIPMLVSCKNKMLRNFTAGNTYTAFSKSNGEFQIIDNDGKTDVFHKPSLDTYFVILNQSGLPTLEKLKKLQCIKSDEDKGFINGTDYEVEVIGYKYGAHYHIKNEYRKIKEFTSHRRNDQLPFVWDYFKRISE